ncbi:MAG TPA: N-acetyl-alpha-D-glucosaminyl L-malate synthase BshA [Bacillales bacterium]|nr:N-acetyl-alpha-D-glucosaminyl L-malate synthase BshA [Bacillales bacterium]
MADARKLKIGITCYPTVGGSGVVATELGKMLAQNGHEVHFITSDVPIRLEKLDENIFYHEVEVNQYAVFRYPPYDLTLASKMAEVARRERLDLLHVHYAVPHAVCAFLAKKIVGDHLKIVTTLHGTDITVLGYDPTLVEMIRLGIDQSDKVTAVSDDLIQQTRELIETNKPIETVYNFVDENVYYKRDSSALRERFRIRPNEKVIVHVSNFRGVKRSPDVIEVFAKVREQMAAKLLLIGEGPDLNTCRKLVAQKQLEDDVFFLGNQKNVAEILSMCDLKLLLSEKESFGLVLLEAMACGVPAIGTKTGGIPEVIVDGETGYLCEVGDLADMSRKAISILTDAGTQESMSKKAVERVCETFHSEKILRHYERIYYEILGEART